MTKKSLTVVAGLYCCKSIDSNICCFSDNLKPFHALRVVEDLRFPSGIDYLLCENSYVFNIDTMLFAD